MEWGRVWDKKIKKKHRVDWYTLCPLTDILYVELQQGWDLLSSLNLWIFKCCYFPLQQGQLLRRTHIHRYISGSLLWSTDIAGFGSNTQGAAPKVKSCLSDWRLRCRNGTTEREKEVESESSKSQSKKLKKSLESAEGQQDDWETDFKTPLPLCTWNWLDALFCFMPCHVNI